MINLTDNLTQHDTETNIKDHENPEMKVTSINTSPKQSKDKHSNKKKFSQSLEIPQFDYKANSKKILKSILKKKLKECLQR